MKEKRLDLEIMDAPGSLGASHPAATVEGRKMFRQDYGLRFSRSYKRNGSRECARRMRQMLKRKANNETNS